MPIICFLSKLSADEVTVSGQSFHIVRVESTAAAYQIQVAQPQQRDDGQDLNLCWSIHMPHENVIQYQQRELGDVSRDIDFS